jgi:polysaccharide deacetylase 2 family uncharacterized protein YibQ
LTTSKGHFSAAFLQGLAIGLFLYVAIFTMAIVKNSGPSKIQPLAFAVASIARPEIVPETPLAEPAAVPQEPFTVIRPPVPVTHEPPSETAPTPLEADDHSEATTASPPTAPGLPTGLFSPSDLIETTAQGPLPKRAANGLTPFDAYKRPFTDPGKPVIALAILDYGLSDSDSRSILEKLPAEVSLILNPYAGNFDTWKSLAQAKGHEFWINVPIENAVFPAQEDPGPEALLVHSDFKYNQEKFYWALSRTSGYAGMAGFTDPAFLNAQSVLKALWDDAYNRGIGYFEINPAGLEGIEMNAIEKKAPYIRSSSLFDVTAQGPEQWLAGLEREAVDNGFAIGVIRTPYPLVIEAIAGWAGGLESRGFALAPLSAFSKAGQSQPDATAASSAPQPAATDHHASP